MIYFLAAFDPARISGGVRAIYRQVEALNRQGIKAAAISPHGRPKWFETSAPIIEGGGLSIGPGDHVVFPELIPAGHDLASALLRSAARKHCFCQNHYYALLDRLGEAGPAGMGVSSVYACSSVAARFLESAFGLKGVPVVPYAIDPNLFRPGPKTAAIAYMPRKLPTHAEAIRNAFRHRHPDLAHVEWVAIENRTEVETAAILGRCAAFLSLSNLEGFGLPPVEAMASGCVVVGFHGGGGLEYATAENGIWTDPGDMVGTADALASAVRGDAALTGGGLATARLYSIERMEAALLAYFRER